jgi:hypothetical protein
MELSIRQDEILSATIVSLHPHKKLLNECRFKSIIIRKGWGTIRNLLYQANKEA